MPIRRGPRRNVAVNEMPRSKTRSGERYRNETVQNTTQVYALWKSIQFNLFINFLCLLTVAVGKQLVSWTWTLVKKGTNVNWNCTLHVFHK